MIKVHYNKVYAIVLIVLSVINLALGAMIAAPTTMLLGAVLIVIGVLFLVQPYFTLEDGIIHVKNVYGMSMRRYNLGEYALVELEQGGSRIFLVAEDGTRKRVKVTRWLSHRPEWEAFTTAVVSANAFD